MNTSAAAANAAPQDLGNIKRLPILISLIIGAFFSILNETLLNIAFVDLSIDFNVDYTTVQWLSTSYLLVVGILVPVSALLVQWFTTRQMFLGAMTLFSIGTLVCALAPEFYVLLIGRIIQALGTGLMLPVMMNTILVLYPPEKRGAAMGSMGLVIMFAPAIGPTLSGLILESLDWRWLFYLVLPFAVFSILFAAVFLKNVSTITKPKVDILSILLSTVAFGGLVFGFSSLGEGHGGWSSERVYLPVIIGGVALILFIWRQLVSKVPMLDLRAFKAPMFSFATVLIIIVMMSLFSTLLLLPILMQQGMLLTAFAAGLVLLPGGIANGLLSPITGKLFDKFGPRALVIPGAAILVVVMYFFTQISLDTSKGTLILLHVTMSIAMSMIMMPAQTNGLNQLSPKFYPHGSAIMNTLQQISGAIGIAFFISVMTTSQKNYLAGVADPTSKVELANSLSVGVNSSFKLGLVFAVIALIMSLFIKSSVAPKA
ncbi:DHA2 family efflux MFS transporter permease subunit [Paenibacillus pinisoli]|uniref:DHA2 family efflux MFS transporter permease subunit n=1 Tax=Paenibacillus pinisoli TaxID=1276110 RepID=A0A3A6P8J9_9BACL|nr:MDR family MFS transporter [Paenibacillus pinisoli]RJX36922.1 DHA2 family efflux MFS transporter permease subunit [Paenibacillus pinisoli]